MKPTDMGVDEAKALRATATVARSAAREGGCVKDSDAVGPRCCLRICFVSFFGYAVLAGSKLDGVVGGAEVQQVLIAKELARRGHDVSMISLDFGQAEGTFEHGVRLFKIMARNAGVPGLRFFHPLSTSLWSAMRRADADVYYQRCAGRLTGMVVGFAEMLGKRSFFAGASDSDFDPKLPRVGALHNKLLYRYGLRKASGVVVQSERQLALCRSSFGRKAAHINSCYEGGGGKGAFDGPIVWVGTFRQVKRPDLFVEVARRLPRFRFVLVGGAMEGVDDYDAVRRRAAGMSNLTMTGHLPLAEVESFFEGASLLVNTSVTEGFPNTFLQAWSRGIPTVSFFDSGAREQGVAVGRTVRDVDAMVQAISELKANEAMWRECGARAIAHFQDRFTVARAVDDYERVFSDAVRTTTRGVS